MRGPAGEFSVSFFCFGAGGVEIESGLEVVRGREGSTLGWFSPRYMDREPAPSLVATDSGLLPLRRVTLISLGADEVVEDASLTSLTISLDSFRFAARLTPPPYPPDRSLIASAEVEARDGRTKAAPAGP
jgi:hypothetical protein